jgi:hypothetical protein
MSNSINRREAIRRLALLSGAAVSSRLLLACKSKPNCEDVSGLSPDEVTARNVAAGYAAQSPDAAKRCSGCVHYVAAAPNACGGCKVVKGPIDPDGTCRLWTARPS